MKYNKIVSFFASLVCTIPLNLYAADSAKVIYSPYAEDNFPNNVYWGDTHLHTSLSFDAYGDGNTKMGSDAAYDFAKGKVIKGHDGLPVRISRPIDFIVIADHAELIAVSAKNECPPMYNTMVLLWHSHTFSISSTGIL